MKRLKENRTRDGLTLDDLKVLLKPDSRFWSLAILLVCTFILAFFLGFVVHRFVAFYL